MAILRTMTNLIFLSNNKSILNLAMNTFHTIETLLVCSTSVGFALTYALHNFIFTV